MAPESTSPSTVAPLTARKTWRTVEPLHGMIYFAPEAAESYARLGIRNEAGYFASRSAPMGAVGGETVIATFYNFRPELVRGAMAGVWDIASPQAVLRAREEAADAALRRMLGVVVDSPEMERAASLLRRAAERAARAVRRTAPVRRPRRAPLARGPPCGGLARPEPAARVPGGWPPRPPWS